MSELVGPGVEVMPEGESKPVAPVAPATPADMADFMEKFDGYIPPETHTPATDQGDL